MEENKLLLDVRDISVHYGKTEAIKGISLKLEEGEIITIIGNNGGGKTTILRAISGLNKLTSGEIWFQGYRTDGTTPDYLVGLGIAHVPEDRRLFVRSTVLENLRLGAYLRKDRQGVKADLEEIYAYFPVLKERRNQYVGRLSGGEQQEVAIARAMMSKPKLILLDEPSMGLSPILIREVGKIIARLNQQGIGILLVEQNVYFSLNLAHTGYILETGMIVLQGLAKDLLGNEQVKKTYLGE